MQFYKVTARCLQLQAGSVVQLFKEQAARRKDLIVETEILGQYRLLYDLQFKQGEIIGYAGELPKTMAHLVDKLGKPAKKEMPAKKLAIQPDLLAGCNVLQAQAKIKEINSLEALQVLKDYELAQEKPRASVIRALERRFDQLNNLE